jgi:aminopeptidase N
MIANIVGEANFRKGLNIYLNRHKYKNAVTEVKKFFFFNLKFFFFQDLWHALSEASGFNVKEFMDNYTKTTGYPLVSIEPDKENSCKFHVKQQRFLADGGKDNKNPVNKKNFFGSVKNFFFLFLKIDVVGVLDHGHSK